MITAAKDVDDWMTKVPSERQDALERIRLLIHKYMDNATEGMDYRMPSYSRNDKVEMAFNSQKNYISLYVMKQDVMMANASCLKGINHGKGCVRFPNPDKIDWDLVEHLISESAASSGEAC